MKRWIVFGLIALAVVVLVSPGIVGKLAERNLRTSITRAELDLPATQHSPAFSWPSLLLALKASADVRVPAAVLDMARAVKREQTRSLIASGILKREGDTYVMKARYAQGLVTVNGAPLPLPLGLIGTAPRN